MNNLALKSSSILPNVIDEFTHVQESTDGGLLFLKLNDIPDVEIALLLKRTSTNWYELRGWTFKTMIYKDFKTMRDVNNYLASEIVTKKLI